MDHVPFASLSDLGRSSSIVRGMADNTARIAEIDTILRNGVRSWTAGGETVQYDFDALRAERSRLIAEDDDAQDKRPVASSINLGCF